MNLPIFYVDDLIQRAITEDINYIDVTSDYLLEDDDMSQAIGSPRTAEWWPDWTSA